MNDFKLRNSIKKARGFCHFHAWKLQSAGDHLAHAIIYEELLNEQKNVLEKFRRQAGQIGFGYKRLFLRKGGRDIFNCLKEWLTARDVCPMCKMVQESEENYLSALQEYIANDDEFRRRFISNVFLCNPHLSSISKGVKTQMLWI